MTISRSSTGWPSDPIVKDLKPEDLQQPPVPRPRTALEIARAACERIGNGRGGLFSTMPDDLPWRD